MNHPVNTYLLRDDEVKMFNENDVISIIHFDSDMYWKPTLLYYGELGYEVFEG